MTAKFHKPFILSLAAALFLVAGCSTTPQEKEIEVDIDDHGSQVTLGVNEVLVVSLESTPSSGYGWEITEIDGRVIQQVGEVEFVEKPGIPQVGDWDVEVFRFEPVVSGECTLTLVYRSAQEPEPPLDTFTITVVVP
jgi:predicted secreted protein